MLSVTRIPPNGWVLFNKRTDDLYGATLHAINKPHCFEFTLFSIEDYLDGSAFFQVRGELYKTHFWAAENALELAEAIIDCFTQCPVHSFPLSLVHEFGGTLVGGYSVRSPNIDFMRLT